jgi:hypothetical protein
MTQEDDLRQLAILVPKASGYVESVAFQLGVRFT